MLLICFIHMSAFFLVYFPLSAFPFPQLLFPYMYVFSLYTSIFSLSFLCFQMLFFFTFLVFILMYIYIQVTKFIIRVCAVTMYSLYTSENKCEFSSVISKDERKCRYFSQMYYVPFSQKVALFSAISLL